MAWIGGVILSRKNALKCDIIQQNSYKYLQLTIDGQLQSRYEGQYRDELEI